MLLHSFILCLLLPWATALQVTLSLSSPTAVVGQELHVNWVRQDNDDSAFTIALVLPSDQTIPSTDPNSYQTDVNSGGQGGTVTLLGPLLFPEGLRNVIAYSLDPPKELDRIPVQLDSSSDSPGQAASSPGQTAGSPGQTAGSPGQTAGPPGQPAGPPGKPAGSPGQNPGSSGHSSNSSGLTSDSSDPLSSSGSSDPLSGSGSSGQPSVPSSTAAEPTGDSTSTSKIAGSWLTDVVTSNGTSTSVPTQAQSPVPSDNVARHHVSTAIIAGIIIGGLVFLSLVIALIFVLRRRKRRRGFDGLNRDPHSSTSSTSPTEVPSIMPFLPHQTRPSESEETIQPPALEAGDQELTEKDPAHLAPPDWHSQENSDDTSWSRAMDSGLRLRSESRDRRSEMTSTSRFLPPEYTES